MGILAIADAQGGTKTYHVGGGVFTVGRDGDNSLVVQSPLISRHHAAVFPAVGGYAIQDLGSKNGVWVNGARLGSEPHPLRPGDMIALGSSEITLRYYDDDTTITIATSVTPSGPLQVDLAGREVTVHGQRISPPLSRKEFDIIALLWERRGAACSRDELAARGWPERGGGDVSEADIEQYIRRLRRRIGDTSNPPKMILTIRRYGYKLA